MEEFSRVLGDEPSDTESVFSGCAGDCGRDELVSRMAAQLAAARAEVERLERIFQGVASGGHSVQVGGAKVVHCDARGWTQADAEVERLLTELDRAGWCVHFGGPVEECSPVCDCGRAELLPYEPSSGLFSRLSPSRLSSSRLARRLSKFFGR